MRSRRHYLLITVAIAALCFGGWTGYGQRENPKPKRPTWEYKVEDGLSQEQLNELGSQGWELVAVSIGNGQASIFLKRAK